MTEHSRPQAGAENYRWVICGLLCAATSINYLDRQVLAILAPTLQQKIGWSEREYGHIVTAFQAAYAIGFLGFGRFVDARGTKLGYGMAVGIWSLAACGALCSVPLILVPGARHLDTAIWLIGLAAAGHMGWAANLFTIVSDLFPANAVATVVGVGGAFSADPPP